MHGVVKYRLGSVHGAPKEGDVKRMKGQDPANYWKQAKRENFNSLRGMLQHFGGRSGEALLGFCLWFTLSMITINPLFCIFLKVKFTVTKWFNMISWLFLISPLFCVICMDFINLTWLLFKMARWFSILTACERVIIHRSISQEQEQLIFVCSFFKKKHHQVLKQKKKNSIEFYSVT